LLCVLLLLLPSSSSAAAVDAVDAVAAAVDAAAVDAVAVAAARRKKTECKPEMQAREKPDQIAVESQNERDRMKFTTILQKCKQEKGRPNGSQIAEIGEKKRSKIPNLLLHDDAGITQGAWRWF
jgi:hypothetical protein